MAAAAVAEAAAAAFASGVAFAQPLCPDSLCTAPEAVIKKLLVPIFTAAVQAAVTENACAATTADCPPNIVDVIAEDITDAISAIVSTASVHSNGTCNISAETVAAATRVASAWSNDTINLKPGPEPVLIRHCKVTVVPEPPPAPAPAVSGRSLCRGDARERGCSRRNAARGSARGGHPAAPPTRDANATQLQGNPGNCSPTTGVQTAPAYAYATIASVGEQASRKRGSAATQSTCV